MREAVRFCDGVRTLEDEGVTTFLELGPDGVLTAMVLDSVRETSAVVAVPLMRRDRPEPRTALLAAGHLHARGHGLDPARLHGDDAHRTELPSYAFQRERYWLEPSAAPAAPVEDTPFWDLVEQAVQVERAEQAEQVEHVGQDAVGDLAARLGLDENASLREVMPALASWRRGLRERSEADAWEHRVVWTPAADPAAASLTGVWLLPVPAGLADGAWTASVADALAVHGARTVLVPVDCAETDRKRLGELLTGILDGDDQDTPVTGVLSLLAADERPLPGHPSTPSGLAATAALVQALADGALGTSAAPLWCLTAGAVGVNEQDAPAAPEQAAVWGLGRTTALEHPRLWGGLVDLPPVPAPRCPKTSPGACARCSAAGKGEDQVAVRRSGTFLRRLGPRHALRRGLRPLLERHRPADRRHRRPGVRTAAWLAEQGGRTDCSWSAAAAAAPRAAPNSKPPSPGFDVELVVAACDVADREALASGCLRPGRAPGGRGGAHRRCPRRPPARHPTGEAWTTCCGPSWPPRCNLHELTRERDLSAFVLFASVSGTLGSHRPGQLRRGQRLPGRPRPAAARGGTARDLHRLGAVGGRGHGRRERRHRTAHAARRPQPPGSRPRTRGHRPGRRPPRGRPRRCRRGRARFAPGFTSVRRSPLLSGLPELRDLAAAYPAVAEEENAGEALRARLAGLGADERERALVALVRTQVAEVLGHASTDRIGAGRAFNALGFDSLMAVELRNRLGAVTGLQLPATLLFDHPNATALAGFLRGKLTDGVDGGGVLAELDRLEASLATMDADDTRRDRVGVRLRALLARWNGTDGTAGAPAADGTTATDDITDRINSAAADEIFDFIENDLGIS